MAKPWMLKEALDLIGVIYGDAGRFGYHITFGGDLLRKGISDNEVMDLYFHPIERKGLKQDMEGLYKWLAGIWGKGQPFGDRGPINRPPAGRIVRDEDDDPPDDDELDRQRDEDRNLEALQAEIRRNDVRALANRAPAGRFDGGLNAGEPQVVFRAGANAPVANWAIGGVAAAGADDPILRVAGAPPAGLTSVYKVKLQFSRSGDYINVYIL